MAAKIEIYHNPRCGKSRQAKAILEEKGVDFEVVEYLKEAPTKAQLTVLIAKLGIKPLELIRKGESIFKEQYKGKDLSDSEWIDAMVANPILIERPIVVKGDKAVVARPPELTNDIIGK